MQAKDRSIILAREHALRAVATGANSWPACMQVAVQQWDSEPTCCGQQLEQLGLSVSDLHLATLCLESLWSYSLVMVTHLGLES